MKKLVAVDELYATVDPKHPLARKTISDLLDEGYDINSDVKYLIYDLLDRQPISFVKVIYGNKGE